MNAWNPNVRQKTELILKVRAGLMSATEAAKQLGISRKSYYKWEQRGLEAMMEGLCERNPGRPHGDSDTEKEELKRRIRKLEKELERKERSEQLRELVKQLPEKKE